MDVRYDTIRFCRETIDGVGVHVQEAGDARRSTLVLLRGFSYRRYGPPNVRVPRPRKAAEIRYRLMTPMGHPRRMKIPVVGWRGAGTVSRSAAEWCH